MIWVLTKKEVVMTITNYELAILFDRAVELLEQYEPKEGYYLAFSGGKDSIVLLDIVKCSGVKYDAHFNFTSLDPRSVLDCIKDNYQEVEWHYPKETMYQLVERKGILPTGKTRYCCQYLKERGGIGRICLTGIRAAESAKRSKRNQFEHSSRYPSKRYLHLLFNWSEEQIWAYIRARKLAYPSMYDEGYKRVGCILCPLKSAKERQKDAERFPRHKKAFVQVLDRVLEKKPSQYFATGEDYFNWWISGLSAEKYMSQTKDDITGVIL